MENQTESENNTNNDNQNDNLERTAYNNNLTFIEKIRKKSKK